jgi:hypothetical protein
VKPAAAVVLDERDGSLLDVVDNLLNKGVVVGGEVTLAIAGVDLVYLRLSALLCAADRLLPAAQRRSRSTPPRPPVRRAPPRPVRPR